MAFLMTAEEVRSGRKYAPCSHSHSSNESWYREMGAVPANPRRARAATPDCPLPFETPSLVPASKTNEEAR